MLEDSYEEMRQFAIRRAHLLHHHVEREKEVEEYRRRNAGKTPQQIMAEEEEGLKLAKSFSGNMYGDTKYRRLK